MEESEIKFSVMVSLFNWMQKSKSSVKKRSKFRKFLDSFCRKPGDYFSTIRLILPALDRERGSYGLKEHVLATCVIDALAMSRDSADAQRLLNWRKGGPKTGSSAGNFSLVAFEVLQRRQGMSSGELQVKELNELLDHLASSENRAEKTAVLSDLIRKTNAQEMKCIIMIILKDLKLGLSEKSIFHEFHPDAEDLFNVTCDLKLVCEKLRDRSQRHKRQDIEVGKPVRPQLALRVNDANTAWKKLHGKEVVVECKFDGDRIQIHKNNSEIHFFSRNFLDHPEYGHAMSDIITWNIMVDRCILDGEMLVWDTSTNRFAEFGSNQEIANAAKEGLASDRKLCYVAFDILYVGDTSVIHQTLRERHSLLCKFVKPIKSRLEILVPNGSLNTNLPSGEPCRSLIARNAEEVEKFFKETIDNRDEGIVLKDLDSKWEPSDRSGKWLKLKPEYVRAGSDLDVLVIGGYYGSGRHGGEVAQFLVGLAERPDPNTYPRRFVSFCRVGTGLSDQELDAVITKLKPYFRKYEYPMKAPPSFYQVTNNSKERPDVWVESPQKSIILSITSDIRTIKSEVFAAPYSLRFPRIDQVRFDKPWYECLDVQTFVDLVHSSNGTTQRGADFVDVQDDKPKRFKSTRTGEKKNVPFVPSHFIQTDITNVKGETLIFSKMVFYFANVSSSHSLDLLHKMVVENGGSFSMNLNNSVTHCIAAESRGIKFQAAKLCGDVIHYSWLLECCLQKKLLPLQPKYFLYLSEPSKGKLREEIDEFSDSYYLDVDIEDLKQVLTNISQAEDSKTIDYYKKKYCPKNKWISFHGCYIYFYLPPQTFLIKSEWKILLEFALRRMKVEVSFAGGCVSKDLSQATHLIIMSIPGLDMNMNMVLTGHLIFTKDMHEFFIGTDFRALLCYFFRVFSVSLIERRLLLSERLHVVPSKWLEDCLEKDQKLPESGYSLKPNNLEQLVSAESGDLELKLGCISCSDKPEGQHLSTSNEDVKKRKGQAMSNTSRVVTLPRKEGKTKSGTCSEINLQKGRGGIKQMRRVRARVENCPAKIYENDSDGNGMEGAENNEDCKMISQQSPEIQKEMGNFVSSHEEKVFEQNTGEKSDQGGSVSEIHGVESGNGIVIPENGKLEDMIDPVQAMLMDMIPVLGNSETKSMDRVYGAGEQGEKATSSVPDLENEIPHLDPSSMPEKRKKVSYKDLAGELLKNW